MYHNCYSYAYLSLTHTRIKHTWAIEHSSVECYCAVATVQMQSAHAHRREPKMQICQTHRWFPVYLFCFFFSTSSLSLSLSVALPFSTSKHVRKQDKHKMFIRKTAAAETEKKNKITPQYFALHIFFFCWSFVFSCLCWHSAAYIAYVQCMLKATTSNMRICVKGLK